MLDSGSGVAVLTPRTHRRKPRHFLLTRHLIWSGLLRIIQRLTHIKHADRLELRISYSVRDVLGDKGRVVKDQMEALAQAVQKAGSHQAREEATRVVHAAVQRLHKEEGKTPGS